MEDRATTGDRFTFPLSGETLAVKDSCGATDRHWFCLAHGGMFTSDRAVKRHERKQHAPHRWARWCPDHGPEVP